MGNHLLVNGGIIGLLFPTGSIIVLTLRDELVSSKSSNIDDWDTWCTTNVGHYGLQPLKCLRGGGCVKGYNNVVGLLVLRCPGIFKALLFLECVYHHKCGPHKWFGDKANLM
jgi:hypothetical protein